jgi:pyridoxal phosphate enzyme (YggS family)
VTAPHPVGSPGSSYAEEQAMPESRHDEIARRLGDVRRRIADAATSSGRSSDDVTLVVVTKTWRVSDLEILLGLGVRDLAENKHQEAEEKAAALEGSDVRWHFVGQIQGNKANKIATYADVVHSVDSVRIAQRLNSGAHRVERNVRCLIQVSLDPSQEGEFAGRGGVSPAEIDELAYTIETAGALSLAGVMGVAPLGDDPRPAYARLLEVAQRLQATHPDAVLISAGMSGDFEEAIKAGATHVRVGSAVLGERLRNE